MVSLLQTLRDEVQGTLSDIRQKGAISTLWDATLDAADLVKDAGGLIVDSTTKLISGSEPTLLLDDAGLPEIGCLVELQMPAGQPSVRAKVLAVDSISQPPRVRALKVDSDEELIAVVLEADAEAEAEEGNGTLPGQRVIEELGNQLRDVMEEVREKGASGALKDAALDTVDIVKEGASAAHELGRKGLAALKGEEAAPVPVEPLAPTNPDLEQMYGDTSAATPERRAGHPEPVELSPTPSSPPKAVPKLGLSGGYSGAAPQEFILNSPKPGEKEEEEVVD
eukprot:TRINITY_DN64703_c0_g1_i1.p2 TRINITY_DN64703_c0_g1~~TRINITY_DN64703_c0_g1_i1.p2  ORF type:complete len:298 (-),score=86.26 TRINITY_DN64703_c0_g1_i1:39-881(-)